MVRHNACHYSLTEIKWFMKTNYEIDITTGTLNNYIPLNAEIACKWFDYVESRLVSIITYKLGVYHEGNYEKNIVGWARDANEIGVNVTIQYARNKTV